MFKMYINKIVEYSTVEKSQKELSNDKN